ncbi:GDSL-type esterase/lipase family protein [Rhodococcus sp. IEGM 1330]|uniref:GDSL-type esterase/lipase family protein n=1 Tax=Rhodococcus sp. IEGM 1330 TaxID=3082225 RepID=UPI002953FF11|nr:GDSL-type esterase/lipase family protein [Rhodococcus sp. IEGM 1330]MDV8023762.1 GDSL-type esterase/lipase family protein [Rhodococcus sp. IEGM 1330]
MPQRERWRVAHRVPLVSPYESDKNVPSITLRRGDVVVQEHRMAFSGSAIRVTVSNEHGTHETDVAIAIGDSPATFDGRDHVILDSGSSRTTDPLYIDADRDEPATISLMGRRDSSEQLTYNPSLIHSTLIRSPNGHVGSVPTQILVQQIEVATDDDAPIVVALGDSITAGFGSSVHGYPGVLADHHNRRVLNVGIAGNRLDADEIGPSIRRRLRSDGLSSNPAYLVLQAGINDLATVFPGRALDETDGEHLGQQLLDIAGNARDAGVTVIVATLPPVEGCRYPQFCRPGIDVARDAANQVVMGGAFEVLPLHSLLVDSSYPDTLAPAFDSGDRIHPNDQAAKVIAARIDWMLN